MRPSASIRRPLFIFLFFFSNGNAKQKKKKFFGILEKTSRVTLDIDRRFVFFCFFFKIDEKKLKQKKIGTRAVSAEKVTLYCIIIFCFLISSSFFFSFFSTLVVGFQLIGRPVVERPRGSCRRFCCCCFVLFVCFFCLSGAVYESLIDDGVNYAPSRYAPATLVPVPFIRDFSISQCCFFLVVVVVREPFRPTRKAAVCPTIRFVERKKNDRKMARAAICCPHVQL